MARVNHDTFFNLSGEVIDDDPSLHLPDTTRAGLYLGGTGYDTGPVRMMAAQASSLSVTDFTLAPPHGSLDLARFAADDSGVGGSAGNAPSIEAMPADTVAADAGGSIAGDTSVATMSLLAAPAVVQSISVGAVGTTTAGFTLFAGRNNIRAGAQVSSAGDVNADGYGDVIVGAPQITPTAYVIYGSGSAHNLNLTTGVTSSIGLSMRSGGSTFGAAVGGGMDANGDGYGDALMGEPGALASAGRTYLMLGDKTSTLYSSIDGSPAGGNLFTALAGSADGTDIRGSKAGDFTGAEVSSVGDINNDGFDDFGIGVPILASGSLVKAGAVAVVFGKQDASLPLMDTAMSAFSDPAKGFILHGSSTNMGVGSAVASAGDFNGDGIGDLVVSSASTQQVFVVFGTPSSTAINALNTLNLATGLNGTNGIRLTCSYGSLTGGSVSGAGDINGDGIDDLVIGQTSNTGAQLNYVVLGSRSPSTLNGLNLFSLLSAPDDHKGFAVIARDMAAPGQFGAAVSAAGDINGDGFDDLLIGAPQAAPGGKLGAGEAYVIYGGTESLDKAQSSFHGFGTPGAPSVVDLRPSSGNVIGQDYVVATNAANGDALGNSVSRAGDVNGDGFGDLIIGAYYADNVAGDNTKSGKAYVIFGGDYRGENAGAGSADASINGTVSANFIDGGAHDDAINGLDGNDVLLGGGGNDALNGGVGNDRVLGGLGNDYVAGGSGADVLLGGAGNDTLVMDSADKRVDGGGGIDTLKLDASTTSLDLTLVANRQLIRGIETIDLGVSNGANTLKLSLHDVLDLTGSAHSLTIHGGTTDKVIFAHDNLGSWTKVAGTTDTYSSGSVPSLHVHIDPAIVDSIV